MSDFLNTIGTLHTLEKMGEQGRTIDRQGRALDSMGDALRRSQEDAGMAEAGAAFQRNRANELEALLSKPMAEIAAKNGRFRETYEKQQELLSNWVLSQRAFKELAMKYGALAGKTPEEIQAEGMAAKEIILNGQSQFGNDLPDGDKKNLNRKKAREEKAAKATHSA
ncbi:MAG: hypothetical protein QM625_24035 [Ralstonia sp.]|uniref:Uncharacterized protein n=3 Tax=Burkholderiaceae TaxID=119060 RepID=A0A2S5DYX3_9BURK|nr:MULTISPECIES: hypothetical protein [Burkholderiaceae]EKS9800426.1 hypothetical protein [Burkholderia cepacia]EKS9806953.1 hypothetical protein [Burkholderia cepacia]EKS9814422.1 hypothetical protein [Burkholderia cepacia]EKS9823150.1 hypothetical protein [Burkholderia cepacia]EKS9830734.1 hypothetical protein [Burkholderia cepacia]